MEILNDNKCTNCKEFFKAKDDLCSFCFMKLCVPREEYIKNYCFSQDDMLEILEKYKKDNNIKNKFLSNKEFKILCKLCDGKDSGYIYSVLCGFTDFPSCLLLAKQGDILLENAKNKSNSKDFYKHIHAICSLIIDPWNIKNKINIIRCYYTDGYHLESLPNDNKKLYDAWSKIKFNNFVINNVTDFNIFDCSLCLKTITSHDEFLRCSKCNQYSHFDCVKTYCEMTDKFRCHHCSYEWKNDDEVQCFGIKVTYTMKNNIMTKNPIQINGHDIYNYE